MLFYRYCIWLFQYDTVLIVSCCCKEFEGLRAREDCRFGFFLVFLHPSSENICFFQYFCAFSSLNVWFFACFFLVF